MLYFVWIRIYCNMEKMNCLIAGNGKKKSGGVRSWLQEVLCLPYTFSEKEGRFLELPVCIYAIDGITDREIDELERWENGRTAAGSGKTAGQAGNGRWAAERTVRRRYIRWNRTLRSIRKRLQRKETLQMTGAPQDAALFCSWKRGGASAELLLRFYRHCYRENVLVFRAEQLIVLDGWAAEADCAETASDADGETPALVWVREPERDNAEMAGEEREVLQEIYTTFNYATIVTGRPAAWQEFADMAYEEYGLSVRCVSDSRTLTFRERKTLIVDFGMTIKACSSNFPPDSVYMDLYPAYDRTAAAAAEWGGIPYISLWNALDTLGKDGV